MHSAWSEMDDGNVRASELYRDVTGMFLMARLKVWAVLFWSKLDSYGICNHMRFQDASENLGVVGNGATQQKNRGVATSDHGRR